MITPRVDRRGTGALAATLIALGALLLFVEIGLATDRNWPKMIRVGAAALGYVGTLLASGALRSPQALWRYVLAGLVGGLVSGVVRADASAPLVAAQVVLAGLLLGPAHWLLVRRAAPYLDGPPFAH